MAGKGSHQRPTQIPLKQYEDNWDNIFKTKSKKETKKGKKT